MILSIGNGIDKYQIRLQMSLSVWFRDNCRGGVPIQTTGMFIIVLVIGLTTAGVLFGFGTDVTGPTTVTVESGQCTQTLTFDPQDVDGFADEQAAIDQFADGTFPCVVWLDASGTSEFDDGKPVDEWTDRSTNLLSAQPTGEAPRWTTVDGIPAARFTDDDAGGLSVYLDADNQTLDAESGVTVTMLLYVENRTHSGGLYAITDGDSIGANDSDPALELRQSDLAADSSQADQWWATPGPQSTVTTEGQWAIITHTVDTESGELFVDGDSQGQVDSGVAELGSEIRIGATPSGETFDGYVAEYFLTDERLSTGQRNLVECAMDNKHDSVVDLDAC